MTFTVSVQDTNLTLLITSETRFFKNGKYAISKDLAVGETARGALRQTADGRQEAIRIFMQSDESGKSPAAPPPKPLPTR